MLKQFFSFLSIFFLGTFVLGASDALATKVNPSTEFASTFGGIISIPSSPALLIGKMLQVGLPYIGIIIMVVIIYAGILWLTAGGNETKVTSAKKILYGAVIGLIIVFSASAIVNFIITRLEGAL